jgi:phosphotransferase family enzyme
LNHLGGGEGGGEGGFMVEVPLPGGFVSGVVRVGATVRKSPPPDAPFVRRFLALGWAGAPEYHGVDEFGREVLGFVEGEVPWQPGAPPVSDVALGAVARLVREFHDLTAGTELAGDQEVMCHHDLSPKNTVFRDGLPVAFIDWDIAGPGLRVQDVAHVCWQFVPLGPSADEVAAGRRVRLVADAYGLADPSSLVATVLWWQDRCWRGIEAAADAGVPAMVRLRDSGAVAEVRGAYEWTAARRVGLEKALVVRPSGGA